MNVKPDTEACVKIYKRTWCHLLKNQLLDILIKALTKEGITHNVRDFQSNPLSLSEIETIDARINQTNNNEEQPISIFRGDIKNCKFFCDDKHEEHDEHEVTLAMLALNPLELLERPIVVFGEEAKIGRPEPNDLIAWLKERGVTSE